MSRLFWLLPFQPMPRRCGKAIQTSPNEYTSYLPTLVQYYQSESPYRIRKFIGGALVGNPLQRKMLEPNGFWIKSRASSAMEIFGYVYHGIYWIDVAVPANCELPSPWMEVHSLAYTPTPIALQLQNARFYTRPLGSKNDIEAILAEIDAL